jgi:hypothetical protein
VILTEALEAYGALEMSQLEPEKRFLQRRIQEVKKCFLSVVDLGPSQTSIGTDKPKGDNHEIHDASKLNRSTACIRWPRVRACRSPKASPP